MKIPNFIKHFKYLAHHKQFQTDFHVLLPIVSTPCMSNINMCGQDALCVAKNQSYAICLCSETIDQSVTAGDTVECIVPIPKPMPPGRIMKQFLLVCCLM